MKTKAKIFIILSLLFFSFTLSPHAYALAGGHGGGGGGHSSGGHSGGGYGGEVSYVIIRGGHVYTGGGHSYTSSNSYRRLTKKEINQFILSCSLPVLLISSFILFDKSRTSKYFYEREIDDFKRGTEVIEIFLKIQQAWDKQDLPKVKQYYTDHLFHKHQKVMDKLIHKNMVNHSEIIQVDGLSRYKLKENSFSIDISFQAIDYVLFIPSQGIIKGDPTTIRKFKQRWTFIINETEIQLDKIKEFRV